MYILFFYNVNSFDYMFHIVFGVELKMVVEKKNKETPSKMYFMKSKYLILHIYILRTAFPITIILGLLFDVSDTPY